MRMGDKENTSINSNDKDWNGLVEYGNKDMNLQLTIHQLNLKTNLININLMRDISLSNLNQKCDLKKLIKLYWLWLNYVNI